MTNRRSHKLSCTIDGCNDAVLAKGFCMKHYWRNHRHGSPHAHPDNDGEPLAWLQRHANWRGDDCLIWPFARNRSGYGSLRYQGRTMGAHRAMCFESYGAPADAGMEAAHSCGNGHLGCANPLHLRWATPQANVSDRIQHGRNRKLTDDQCFEIVRLAATEPQARIARRFGVSPAFVCRVVKGQRRPLAKSVAMT